MKIPSFEVYELPIKIVDTSFRKLGSYGHYQVFLKFIIDEESSSDEVHSIKFTTTDSIAYDRYQEAEEKIECLFSELKNTIEIKIQNYIDEL